MSVRYHPLAGGERSIVSLEGHNIVVPEQEVISSVEVRDSTAGVVDDVHQAYVEVINTIRRQVATIAADRPHVTCLVRQVPALYLHRHPQSVLYEFDDAGEPILDGTGAKVPMLDVDGNQIVMPARTVFTLSTIVGIVGTIDDPIVGVPAEPEWFTPPADLAYKVQGMLASP